MTIMFYNHVTRQIIHVLCVHRCGFESVPPREPVASIHDLHVGDSVWMCHHLISGPDHMELLFAFPGEDWEILAVSTPDYDWYDNVRCITMTDIGIEFSPDLKPAERSIPHDE